MNKHLALVGAIAVLAILYVAVPTKSPPEIATTETSKTTNNPTEQPSGDITTFVSGKIQ